MKRLLLALAVAAGLFPATRGAAQQRDSLAATVERLSAEVETLKGRSAAADRILSRLPRISGYLQLGYEWSDDASTFFVKRARVDFQGDISPKIDYRLQLEFASPKIVDIYLRYKPLEALNVQVGQFKVPFSIENTHYVPLKYEFIEYSMAVCRLMGFTDVCGVNATGRDLGAQLYGGLIDRDGYSILNYNVGVFNGEGINIKDKNKSKDVVARLMVQPLRALSFAGYYYWGEVGADYARRTRYGGGVCYDDGRWIARGEYIAGRTGIVSPDVAAPFDSRGYYAMAACWVTPKWLPAARFEQFDEVAGRSAARQTNYTAGVTWQPFKHLRCQLNYTYEQYGGTNPDRNVVKAIVVAGVHRPLAVAHDLRIAHLHVAAIEDEIDAVRLLGLVLLALEGMGGEARFARPVNALVHLAPAVDRADVADRRAVDTRVEIAAENLREIGGVLRALVHHHPDLLAARLVALVVEVHVCRAAAPSCSGAPAWCSTNSCRQ